MAGGIVVIFLIVSAVRPRSSCSSSDTRRWSSTTRRSTRTCRSPPARWAASSWDFLFGVEPINGRDVFSRVVYGARISLLIAFLATLLSVALGTVFGVIAGYVGGWVDTVISRTMDIFLAFPILLFAIAVAGVIPDQAFGLEGDSLRIILMIVIIGLFSWPYIGRIIRDRRCPCGSASSSTPRAASAPATASSCSGSCCRTWSRRSWCTPRCSIPTNILFEAALSFLGVGVRPPTPTWGGMLSEATHWYQVAPNFMLFPGLAIFVTVLAFNLFGDGLRDALDPRSR